MLGRCTRRFAQVLPGAGSRRALLDHEDCCWPLDLLRWSTFDNAAEQGWSYASAIHQLRDAGLHKNLSGIRPKVGGLLQVLASDLLSQAMDFLRQPALSAQQCFHMCRQVIIACLDRGQQCLKAGDKEALGLLNSALELITGHLVGISSMGPLKSAHTHFKSAVLC